MSQVLIGVIGVLLFIGLAIAGAVYLGDRFTQASNERKAAAVVNGLQQVANATNLSNAQNAAQTMSVADVATTSGAGLIADGYLKSAPLNPTGGWGYTLTGSQADGYNNSGAKPAALVAVSLGSSTVNEGVCVAIARQTGMDPTASAPMALVGSLPPAQAGCIRSAGFSGAFAPPNYYFAFMRL